MFYREAGDFKTSYVDDSQTFPIRLDRIGYYAVLVIAFGIIPCPSSLARNSRSGCSARSPRSRR